MRNPARETANASRAVEYAIDRFAREDRGPVARDLIGDLRHLVEHVAMYSVFGDNSVPGQYFEAVKKAISQLKRQKNTRFIADFHFYL